MLKTFFCAAAFLAIATTANAQGQDKMTDYQAIEKTVFDYFDGIREASREKLERAFILDKAHMKSYVRNEQGELADGSMPITEIIEKEWAKGDGAPDLAGHIVSVNIYNEVAAHVVFDFNNKFIDSFQMAKINGQWKIMNKFYVDK